MNKLPIVFLLSNCFLTSVAIAQSVSEIRQAVIPAPAFVLIPPAEATPEDLKAGKVSFVVENLGAEPIKVHLEETFMALAATKAIKMKSADIFLESREIAQFSVVGSDSGDVEVTASFDGSLYKTSSKVTVQPLVKTSLLTSLKTTQTAGGLYAYTSNNIVPLKSSVSILCIGERIGWVSGDQGSAPIIAMPYPTPNADICPTDSEGNDKAKKANTSALKLKVEKDYPLKPGNYSGTLNLAFDGGGEKDRVKLELLQTWPWWLAGLATLFGVFVGFLYRWWSGAAGAVQADRTDATAYKVAALAKADAFLTLRPQDPIGSRLSTAFKTNVCTEYGEILAALNAERGLTRDAEKSKLMSARQAGFQNAASDFDGLVKAFTDLTKNQSNISTSNLKAKVTALLEQDTPTVVQLSGVRLKAESLLVLVPIWNTLETTLNAVLSDLRATQNQFLSIYGQTFGESRTSFAIQIAQDLRDSSIAVTQARRGLDSAEPTPATTAAIQQAVSRALDSLAAVKATLLLLCPPSPWPPAAFAAAAASKTKFQEMAALSVGALDTETTEVKQALLVLRHHRAMLLSMNIIVAVITLLIALISGLGELYWAKPFGWIQAFQAFAWGFGLKVGLDNVYLALDHFFFNTKLRLTPGPATL